MDIGFGGLCVYRLGVHGCRVWGFRIAGVGV